MWDFSVRNKSLPFDSVCGLDKSELELWLHSPVSRNRTQKLPLGLFVLFLSPTVQLEVVSQHHELRHKQHTNSCKQHVHNFHVLVLLCSWDSSGSFQLWEFLRLKTLLLRFLHRLDVITKRYCISIQSCYWTYKRTALPYSFPDC